VYLVYALPLLQELHRLVQHILLLLLHPRVCLFACGCFCCCGGVSSVWRQVIVLIRDETCNERLTETAKPRQKHSDVFLIQRQLPLNAAQLIHHAIYILFIHLHTTLGHRTAANHSKMGSLLRNVSFLLMGNKHFTKGGYERAAAKFDNRCVSLWRHSSRDSSTGTTPPFPPTHTPVLMPAAACKTPLLDAW
jgi:hypothetical protein